MRIIIPLIIAGGLAGCSATQLASTSTTTTNTLSTAQADLSKAINFVQTAEGIANVALIAFPALAPDLTAIEAILNPLMATAQVALTDATQTAPQLQALAAQLTTQAASLTQTAAPAIKVVPSTPAPKTSAS